MEKKIDAVKLMRDIRTKLEEKYAKSPKDELRDLKEKFGYLKKKKDRERRGNSTKAWMTRKSRDEAMKCGK